MGQTFNSTLPTREPEPYVTARELARMMGVSLSTVERLTRSGMPSVVWGARARRYRPSVAMAWAACYPRPYVPEEHGAKVLDFEVSAERRGELNARPPDRSA